MTAPAQQSVGLPTIDVVTTTPHVVRTTRDVVTTPPDVVTTTPVPGPPVERSRVPSDVVTVPAEDFHSNVTPDLTAAITRALPGVSRGDQTGNPFQPDFNYRGFTASAVLGTPQGLAIYQNGTRINETFGDTVNWDFLPESAINKMTLAPNNPVYGLNALGGALAVEMKDGFNYRGVESSVTGGSYGRIGASAQAGGSKGDLAAYIAADAINDAGWRRFSSSSQLRRLYADLGAKSERAEFHMSFTGADNRLGSVAATPLEMLNRDWPSVYTWPQQTHNQLAFLQARGDAKLSDTVSVQGNAYVRSLRQSHTDGNTSDAQPCADPTLLCFGNDSTPLLGSSGGQLPNTSGANSLFGEIDRTWTSATSYGGTVQASSTAPIGEHANRFAVGASIDHGRVHFTGRSELGTLDQNLFANGTGLLIQQPAADLAPIDLRTKSTYAGFYITDKLDLTPDLSLTGGGRFNVARIRLEDQLGTALTSDNTYTRFNPMAGVTYRLRPDLSMYVSYAEANRAPTPLELGCADPAHPCLIDTFLVSDPALKQVVSRTYEAGLRGRPDQTLSWHAGVFRTDSRDDIINVASPISGFGYFQNAAATRRQGIEAGVVFKRAPWSAYANYTFVDATFQSALTMASPFNPAAVNGNISVVPGNHIPAVPAHRFKAGVDYVVSDAWTLGADLNVTGSQYLVGDAANQNPQVPAYWVVNLHNSYKLTKNVEVFGLVQNLFSQHYYAAGTFFDTAAVPFLALSDPRTFIPGMPLAAYGGLRVTF